MNHLNDLSDTAVGEPVPAPVMTSTATTEDGLDPASRAARWLDEREQHTWRSWLRANLLLTATLQRDLVAKSGLSLQDFEVLVLLTDDPDQRLRINVLARGLQWEKSRLSHHLGRMVRRGLVSREECCSDGRGAFIAVTPAGREAIEAAAPRHVELVREVFFGAMTAQDEPVIDGFLARLLARLDDDPTRACD